MADNPNNPPPGRPRFQIPNWLVWLLTFLALTWFTFRVPAILGGASSAPIDIPYSFFKTEVANNVVKAISIGGIQIAGEFNTAVTWPPPDTSAASASAPKPASATSTLFTTTIPPIPDNDLLPLLAAHNVTVTAVDTTPGPLLTLLLNFGPLLLIGLLLFWQFRRMRGQQESIFGFGQSRARRYTEERPSATFADVAGEDAAKGELNEMVDFLKEPDKYLALGARIPRGVLLVGPPGTGKTLLARAVAGEAKVPFFSLSASEFVEMFVGVGASRVRDLFIRAKAAAPCIIFIDELDAVGRRRGAGLGGGNDEREQTLNQLLVEMDGFDVHTTVIVMAATNRPDVLDPALLRPGRFDREVTVGLPDRTGREGILRIHTRQMPLENDVDLPRLAQATVGYSGADLENLANEAALAAARNKHPRVQMRDFEAALDRIMLGSERPALASEDERRTVAYHESGHALAALFTPGADPVFKVSIIPRGRALGVTQSLPTDDRYNYSRDYLMARLVVLLGGRSSEEVALNQITSGAENDLRVATRLAHQMVSQLGMDEAVGPLNYGDMDQQPFLGYSLAQAREYSDETAALIDRQTKRLIDEAHGRARSIIGEHRAQLDAMVKELMEKESIDQAQVAAIVGLAAQPALP
ncbi:MAG TPA: ATP-dependent zinc metalloprotease FtsH [Aggregatilineales bacterium]|nr:ATP-dependent zinc metalloprotease FtsH [Aggregatilineales bacterium]